MCSRVVIERRRNPVLGGVAVAAMRLRILGRELPVVRVLVASLALLRGALESRRIFFRGLVTIAANHGAMRAQQGEFRFAVVKSVDVRPGLRVVASLTSKRRPIGTFLCHPIIEFSSVWIFVAGRAGPVFKSKRQNLVGAAGCARLVTVDASNRRMRARQRKTSVSMLGDGKRSAVEIRDRVAAFTLVVVRRSGELIVVGILVAIAAGSKLYFVNRVLAGRDMALRALHLDVFALQWILGCVVFLHSE